MFWICQCHQCQQCQQCQQCEHLKTTWRLLKTLEVSPCHTVSPLAGHWHWRGTDWGLQGLRSRWQRLHQCCRVAPRDDQPWREAPTRLSGSFRLWGRESENPSILLLSRFQNVSDILFHPFPRMIFGLGNAHKCTDPTTLQHVRYVFAVMSFLSRLSMFRMFERFSNLNRKSKRRSQFMNKHGIQMYPITWSFRENLCKHGKFPCVLLWLVYFTEEAYWWGSRWDDPWSRRGWRRSDQLWGVCEDDDGQMSHAMSQCENFGGPQLRSLNAAVLDRVDRVDWTV